jgi:hypothetical protein
MLCKACKLQQIIASFDGNWRVSWYTTKRLPRNESPSDIAPASSVRFENAIFWVAGLKRTSARSLGQAPLLLGEPGHL